MYSLGPVVQSIVNCFSKYNIVFTGIFAETNVSSFCKCKSYLHCFSKNISIYMYAIFSDQSFNDTLTNNIVSFEQLGLDLQVN